MLLRDVACGHELSLSIPDCVPKEPFRLENALRMMTQGAVTEIAERLLCSVQPIMNCLMFYTALLIIVTLVQSIHAVLDL